MLSEGVRLKLNDLHEKLSSGFMLLLTMLALVSGVVCFAVMTISDVRPNFKPTQGQEQSTIIRRRGRATSPLIRLVFRGDVGMNAAVRASVDRAIVDLDRVSCGLARASVVWDYRRDEDLLRSTIVGDSVVQAIDAASVSNSVVPGRPDDSLLGMTQMTKDPRWNPVWIFLVTDRLEDDVQLAEWTALHELGHALGMEHVKVGLMEPYAPYFFHPEDRLEWSVDDQNEFCRLYKCDVTAFVRCDVR